MLPHPELTISEIVRSNYRAAAVFRKYNINYCCSGQATLGQACSQRNLDQDTIFSELEEATRNIQLPNELKFSEWKIDFLVDYIINIHHAYLKKILPALELSLVEFISNHHIKFIELKFVLETFRELSAILQIHNRHEEEIIFPYIKQIEAAHRRKEAYGNLFVRTLRKPLSNIEKEHSQIGVLLQKLKSYTNNFEFPPNACTNHQVLYHKLREFHDDMMQHKHLENNILFPRAVEIENDLLRL
jgi:regulator of cell morphogenesis and NO signaling